MPAAGDHGPDHGYVPANVLAAEQPGNGALKIGLGADSGRNQRDPAVMCGSKTYTVAVVPTVEATMFRAAKPACSSRIGWPSATRAAPELRSS
jgi:hypothetical protein